MPFLSPRMSATGKDEYAPAGVSLPIRATPGWVNHSAESGPLIIASGIVSG